MMFTNTFKIPNHSRTMFTNTFKPPDHSCLVNNYPQSLYQFEVSASTRYTWGLPFTITAVVLNIFNISVSLI